MSRVVVPLSLSLSLCGQVEPRILEQIVLDILRRKETSKDRQGTLLNFEREFEKEGRYSRLDFNFRVRNAEEKGVAMQF